MADLRGKGAMTDVSLIAVAYDNAKTKNGKTQFVDVQIDHRDPRAKGQSNLHLYGKPQEQPDGSQGWTSTQGYSKEKQWDKMLEAAGPNQADKLDVEGNVVGKVIGFKANLMKADNPREGAIVRTTKELKQSDFKVEEGTLDAQYESMSAAKQTKEAQQGQAPQTETEAAVAVEQQADEPTPVG